MCHSVRQLERRPDRRAATKPIVPEPHGIRASDSERESAVEALRAHASAGRLSTDELEQRIESAYAAERRADLAALLEDLPPLIAPQPRDAPSSHWWLHRPMAIAILLVAIWALTGAGYFWPVWPLGAMAFSLFAHRGAPRSRGA